MFSFKFSNKKLGLHKKNDDVIPLYRISLTSATLRKQYAYAQKQWVNYVFQEVYQTPIEDR